MPLMNEKVVPQRLDQKYQQFAPKNALCSFAKCQQEVVQWGVCQGVNHDGCQQQVFSFLAHQQQHPDFNGDGKQHS